MRPRDKASEPQPSKIIDIDVNAPAPASATDDDNGPAPQTFRERHALKVMGVIGAGMLATVIIAQVGC